MSGSPPRAPLQTRCWFGHRKILSVKKSKLTYLSGFSVRMTWTLYAAYNLQVQQRNHLLFVCCRPARETGQLAHSTLHTSLLRNIRIQSLLRVPALARESRHSLSLHSCFGPEQIRAKARTRVCSPARSSHSRKTPTPTTGKKRVHSCVRV